MKDLIAGLISKDCLLEITYLPKNDGVSCDTVRGNFIQSDDSALALQLEAGRIRILPIASICYLDILTASDAMETHAPHLMHNGENMTDDSASADSDGQTATDAETGEFTDKNDSSVYSNTPILTAPKVVGHIDLQTIERGSRTRRSAIFESGYTSFDSTDDSDSEELIPAMGKVVRMGPNFGFIQPNDPEAKSIYVARNEILSIHGLIKAPMLGDEVVYTPSLNRQGTAAKCVHVRCSLHTLEEMAGRLSAYDPRNTAILKARIKAVQDGTPLEDAYTGFPAADPRRGHNTFERPESLRPDTVLAMVENGESVTARNITECEESLSMTLPYAELIGKLEVLLAYSMERNLTSVHRLLSRGIRVARENEDIETALRFAQKACEYYRDMPGNFKFFSAIEHRLLHPVQRPTFTDSEADSPAGEENVAGETADDSQAEGAPVVPEAAVSESSDEEPGDTADTTPADADGESRLITI